MTQDLHTGSLIAKKLREKERTVSWFANKLCCSRNNIYKIFQKPHIDTELLLRISIILDFDFFSSYSDYLKKLK
ncbi:MAG: XRE family transcriptional regulator [Bacteroidales bacterium]|nr:XRE family transcriptional regulator [Bacteroidales bacterium]